MLTFDVVSGRLPQALSSKDLTALSEHLGAFFRLRREALVTIRFVTEAVMQKINQAERGKNHPTDVLSFATSEAIQVLTPRSESVDWGDIILCPTYAGREAKRRGIAPREELIRLLVHGILHLRGYDHAEPDEEAKMFSLQERFVRLCLDKSASRHS